MQSKEWKHPELKDKEVFMMNISPQTYYNYAMAVPSYLEGMRMGKTAYTKTGERVVVDMRPLIGKIKDKMRQYY